MVVNLFNRIVASRRQVLKILSSFVFRVYRLRHLMTVLWLWFWRFHSSLVSAEFTA